MGAALARARAIAPCLPSPPDAGDDDANDDGANAQEHEKSPSALAVEQFLAREDAARRRRERAAASAAPAAASAAPRGVSSLRYVIDHRDSGAVELVVAWVTSTSALRDAEREARLRDSDEARRTFGTTRGAGGDDDASSSMAAAARGTEGGIAKERFVAALYASVEASSADDKDKWLSLGRHACEPSVDKPHVGILVPVFRDEEKRRSTLARSLIAAPKWTIPPTSRVSSTTFHLILSTIVDGATARGGVADGDATQHALDAKRLLDDAKTRLVGEVKFQLMDLCADANRELRLEVYTKSTKQTSLTVDVKQAEITIRLTPPEISRAWCESTSSSSATSKVARARDSTPRDAMSFETLFEQYEAAVLDANAVVGIDHYNARKARLKAQLARVNYNAQGSTASSRTKASFRLAAADDADLIDEDSRTPSRPPNRASGARKRPK